MKINSLGIAKTYDDIPFGAAFLSDRQGTQYFGIKTQIHGTFMGMVVIAPGAPSFVEVTRRNTIVLSIPDLRFSLDCFTIGTMHNITDTPGQIYLYPEKQLLVCETGVRSDSRNTFLDIESGELIFERDFNDFPVLVAQWSLVVDLDGERKTIFKYPGGTLAI